MPEKVLVVDDDSAVAYLIEQLLNEIGVKTVKNLQSSVEAWDEAMKEVYDLVILDWKIPEVSGLALLSRFRADDTYATVPILVISGFLSKEDLTILGEYLLTGFVEKPVQKGFLHPKVSELYNESLWFKDKEERLLENFRDLEKEDISDAVDSLEKLLKESNRPVPLGVIATKILIAGRHFEDAERILNVLLKKSPDSILALHLLGKIKLLTKNYDQALELLKKAYTKSPKNLERLNLIGNANLQKLQYDEAQKYFDKALSVDDANKMAQEGVKLVTNIKTYIKDQGVEQTPKTLASLLNAIGISEVKKEAYEDAVEHYVAAITHINDTQVEAKVELNLGLAYLRWKRPQEALYHMEKALKLNPAFEKAQSLQKRIKTVIDKGPKKTPAELEELAKAALPNEEKDLFAGDPEEMIEDKKAS